MNLRDYLYENEQQLLDLKPAGGDGAEAPVTLGENIVGERLIHDEQGRPVQWLHGLYRPDRYQYQMELSRVGSIDAKVWVSKALAARFH